MLKAVQGKKVFFIQSHISYQSALELLLKMARVRSISRNPKGKLFYLVDANFLVNKFIPYLRVTNEKEKARVLNSQNWWVEIDKQLKLNKAMIYVLDVCIAESFKVLAKKYYEDKYFKNAAEYKLCRDKLSKFVHISPKVLKSQKRIISVHDISTSRDIVIAVDRFYEIFIKNNLSASVIDLLILATAKYLIDFYSIPRDRFFIVTLDNSIWKGSKKISEIKKNVFNPNSPNEFANRVFI